MPTISDYLLKAGASVVQSNVFVRLTNNVTGTSYVSTAVTDSNGMFTVNNAPAGLYTVATGPTVSGPWTNSGDANYEVAPGNLGFFNVLDWGADATGASDSTVAIQATINAASAVGGGVVWMPKGTFTVDFVTGSVVGTVPTGSRTNCCLYLPSNVWLRGAGVGITVLQVKAVVRTANVSGNGQSVIINQHPELTTDTNVAVSDFTLDCNRANQGPYVYNMSLAVAANFLFRGISFWAGSKFNYDNVGVKNCPDFGIFIEAVATNISFGRVFTTNCVAGLSVDSATNGTLNKMFSINADAAYVVNTTATTTVAGGGSVVVTPVSMTGIAVNGVLDIAIGTNVWETVLVTAVTGTTFTAYFANAHGPGSYAINDARFHSDGAVQANLSCAQFTFDDIDVDYTAAVAVTGPAMEISGAKNIVVGSLIGRGTFRVLWLHSWNISATHYIPTDIAVGQVVGVNCVNSGGGVFSQAVYIDDHAFGTPGTDTIKDVSIASVVVRYGFGGATIPNAVSGMQIQPNVTNLSVGVLVVDGAYWGIILNGCSRSVFAAVNLRNLQNQGLQVQASATGNAFGAVLIDTTGVANGAQGQGIQFVDNTACNDNVFHGLQISNVPGASAVLDLSANTTATRNQFSGDVSSSTNGGILVKTASGAPINYFQLGGFNSPLVVPTPLTGQTAAVTTGAVVTSPNDALKHRYRVGGAVTITTLGSGNINLQVAYTDCNGTARTCNIPICAQAGTWAASATTADDYKGELAIEVNPNTSVTLQTAGTFTGCTYNLSRSIEQLA